jgi:hypothetical protein
VHPINAARDKALPALVLAGENIDDGAGGDLLAAIHGLLR